MGVYRLTLSGHCGYHRGHMVLKTMGFLNPRQLARHFLAHGADFGASNAQEYERFADDFLSGPVLTGVQECVRGRGDRVRYDPATQCYGVLDNRGTIRTYYKPVPCNTVPVSVRAAIRLAGRCHGHTTNLSYFQAECRKW